MQAWRAASRSQHREEERNKMNANVFGFSTEPSTAADFTPIVKYDARAGRMFRVDRLDTGNGFENNPVDITQGFKAIFDFENVEVGWLNFTPGAAPDLRLVAMGKQLPDRPSPTHKNGIRLLVKLTKACGGDKPVREIAGTSKAFLSGVEAVYAEYAKEKAKYPGQLPVLVLEKTTPVKSGSGERQSTNYHPTFRIDGWMPRPADLIHIRKEQAPPAATAPSTGSTAVPPPGAAASTADDNDFG
jgi:hypothetical protein